MYTSSFIGRVQTCLTKSSLLSTTAGGALELLVGSTAKDKGRQLDSCCKCVVLMLIHEVKAHVQQEDNPATHLWLIQSVHIDMIAVRSACAYNT